MKKRQTTSSSEFTHRIYAVILLALVSIVQASPAFASEPGGASLIFFFGGLFLAPLLQLILYPILVAADAAKLWTIVALGTLSLAWSAFVSFLLVGFIAYIYFGFTILLFTIAYLMKISKIEKKQSQSGKQAE